MNTIYVRIFAAGAPGNIGPKARSAVEVLTAAANDPTLHNDAEWALSRIAGVKSGEPVASALVPAPSVVPPLQKTVVETSNPPVDWNKTTFRNIVWSVELGNETFGRPVVVGDAVDVGTNNNARHINLAYQEEAGVLMAFQAKDGKSFGRIWPRVERGLREFLLPSTIGAPYVAAARGSFGTFRQREGYDGAAVILRGPEYILVVLTHALKGYSDIDCQVDRRFRTARELMSRAVEYPITRCAVLAR